jgi:hypothetical protein
MNFLFLNILLFFLFTSCSVFKTKRISKDLNQEIQNVCLDSYGAGRIIVNKHKYVFRFDTALSMEDHKWMMGLNFPIYGEEVFEFEWDNDGALKYKASFEQRILQDKSGVDPEKLEIFLKKWSEFINEVIQLQYTKNYSAKYKWKLTSKFLQATSKINKSNTVKIVFQNKTSAGHFGRFDIMLHDDKHEDNFKLEMIVRKCLEKTE